MPHADVILLFLAAVVGQALNAVAGGGSFITFPMLLVAGVAPIEANATSTIALWPGALASAWGYRRDFSADRRTLIVLACVSVAGGLAGALLLLATPEQQFRRLIPYLLGFATLLFALSDRFGVAVGPRSRGSAGALAVVGLIQFAVAVYGGYFGGGIGFLMLAALTLAGLSTRNAGATKNALAGVMNAAAVVLFVFSPQVHWLQALVLGAGAIVGGLAGAWALRRVNERALCIAIACLGAALTVGLFLRPI